MRAAQAGAHDADGCHDYQKGKQKPSMADLHRMQGRAKHIRPQCFRQQCGPCEKGAGRKDQQGRKGRILTYRCHGSAVRQRRVNDKR